MTVWRYTFSNRQKKEFARGTAMRIAIPVDPALPDDPSDLELGQWLSDRLPSLRDHGKVASWRCCDVWVSTSRGSDAQGINAILGGVCKHVDADAVAYLVAAVVLVVQPPRLNGSEHPTQFPGGEIEREQQK